MKWFFFFCYRSSYDTEVFCFSLFAMVWILCEGSLSHPFLSWLVCHGDVISVNTCVLKWVCVEHVTCCWVCGAGGSGSGTNVWANVSERMTAYFPIVLTTAMIRILKRIGLFSPVWKESLAWKLPEGLFCYWWESTRILMGYFLFDGFIQPLHLEL